MKKVFAGFKYVAIAFLLILLVLGSYALIAAKPAPAPKAANGHINLASWSCTERPQLRLDGEWLFTLADNVPLERHPVLVPGSWNSKVNPPMKSPYGAGTYYLRVVLPPHEEPLALYAPDQAI